MQENIIIAGHHAHAQVSTSWQQQLSHAIRDPDTLCQRLGLDAQWLPGAQAGHRLFDICVPDAYLARIKPNDPNDPLLRQVLPIGDETLASPGYVTDPLEEADHRPVKVLIHKYANRVLLIASPACAINCRYCFR
ncbi:MAG: EF-P beta-lysylation protein EpmB, partial [Pseudomonadota bacterium]|nr:EF-P beta-lysylation protein EpmB [Pseudomonadota bacterium]